MTFPSFRNSPNRRSVNLVSPALQIYVVPLTVAGDNRIMSWFLDSSFVLSNWFSEKLFSGDGKEIFIVRVSSGYSIGSRGRIFPAPSAVQIIAEGKPNQIRLGSPKINHGKLVK